MDRWTGVLAYFDTQTEDGRVLRAPQELRTREFPLPLTVLADAYKRLGTIDSVTVHGNELRAKGRIEDGVLRPGERLPVGIDVDQVDVPEESDGPQVFTSWRLVAATAYVGESRMPAWPGAHIRLADSPEDQAAQAVDGGLDRLFHRLGPPDA